MSDLQALSAALEKGEATTVEALTKEALEAGLGPQEILDGGLIAGMSIVGEKFRRHEIFLPDVLLAARAMYAGMDLLKPLMIREGIPTIAKVVVGTVQGDLHDIGKNLVAIMLRGAGFEVIDLGRDVAPERFVDEAEKSGAQIIGLSALLTTTMPVMAKVVELARERGLLDRTRIVVGGAPLSEDYAREIGADAYCFDGLSAVDRVKELVGSR
jgi:5-methyltetrahydrofolate--homocysteine methyltransferase